MMLSVGVVIAAFVSTFSNSHQESQSLFHLAVTKPIKHSHVDGIQDETVEFLQLNIK